MEVCHRGLDRLQLIVPARLVLRLLRGCSECVSRASVSLLSHTHPTRVVAIKEASDWGTHYDLFLRRRLLRLLLMLVRGIRVLRGGIRRCVLLLRTVTSEQNTAP
jgi:hypothetical protein